MNVIVRKVVKMVNIQNVTDDIRWIGASDRRISRFENLFPLSNGVSYNSYIVMDNQIVLFDTCDAAVADQYFENLNFALSGKKPDYLVILHMEPDHCSQIGRLLSLYPDIILVGSVQTFKFLHQFFPELDDVQRIVVKEGEVLQTNNHTFKFIAAPMVHWPEVLMVYDEHSKLLFSADAFGTFGALSGSIFADEYDFAKDLLDESRRYYANIVGKFGPQVQAVLKKTEALDIKGICPLHGPVWRKDIDVFIEKYKNWSSYTPESDEILLIYGSMYGHTASAAEKAAALLKEKSEKNVVVYDVSKTDSSFLIGEAFRCGKIVLFAPTYNGGLYLPIHALIHDFEALNLQNRIFALAQNGTWAPMSGKIMQEMLSHLKNCTVLPEMLTITSALDADRESDVESFIEQIVDA